jgi:Domain of unknown function (DUF4440)
MKFKTNIPVLVLIMVVSLAACSGPKEKIVTPETKQYKPVSQELYDTIARMDSIMFDALARRDTVLLKDLFTKDLEFYHDKGGLTDYENMINVSKTLFTKENGLKRELVPGSLEVYPIKDYGAIQEAKHRFCHPENGKEDCGTFKFIHIWKREDGKWKVSRVVSYDHN